ncbi:MAG: hypothetical protein JRF33_19645 [Deltaproteobacteria bacterium]|nr:hypothetical protein [Deltaproteobacteria bacterium]
MGKMQILVLTMSLAFAVPAMGGSSVGPHDLGAGFSLVVARLSLGFGFITGEQDKALAVAGAELLNFSHDHLILTAIDVNGGVIVGGNSGLGYGALGSRIGYPLYLDELGDHQLQFGVALSFGSTSKTSWSGLLVSPFFRYMWKDCVGAEFKAVLPTERTANGDFPMVFVTNAVVFAYWGG